MSQKQPVRSLLLAWLLGLLGAGILSAQPTRVMAQPALPAPATVPVPSGVIYGDEFGAALAIAGDFLAVGAPRTNVGGTLQQGVVYLYRRAAGNPQSFTLVKTLTGSDSGEYDAFGAAVALDGDTLVVGAIYADPGGLTNQGAAYVFQRNQGGADNWGEVKKLVVGDQTKFVNFGAALAIHGDTIVAGAPTINGRAFIYARNAGGANQWGQTQTLSNNIDDQNDSFGGAIIFDGVTIVIGAINGDLRSSDIAIPGFPPPDTTFSPYNNAGTVFVYKFENDEWTRKAKLFHSDISLEERSSYQINFGGALALQGDTLFVGARRGKVNDSSTGKVFVYQLGAGAESPYGEPGGWGEVAQLTAADGADGDNFGSEVHSLDGGVFVSAPGKGLNGTVYFFQNLARLRGGAQRTGWSEAYNFTTPAAGAGSRFGEPITHGDNNLLIGARGSNSVFSYPADQMVAAGSDPGPTPQPAGRVAFLPLVARGAGAIQITAVVTGTLANGAILSGPGGMKIGAVAGALDSTEPITLATVAAPTTALPSGLVPRSAVYRIDGAHDVVLAMETPLIVSIPVAAGADGGHLALAYLLPPGQTNDTGAAGEQWALLPAVYDAAQNVIFAKLAYLAAHGRQMVVVENTDLYSPPNAAAVRATAAPDDTGFWAFCLLYTNPGDCTPGTRADVEAYLDFIYDRMVNTYGFTGKPRLTDTNFQVVTTSGGYTITTTIQRYSTSIFPETGPYCAGAAGYYTPETGTLVLCRAPGAAITGETEKTLAHEYFHATEFAYQRVWDDRLTQQDEDWVIEGMAHSASESHLLPTMKRSSAFGLTNLHTVDTALNQGTVEEPSLVEYLAQDFWVYLGQRHSRDMSYLGPLLAQGGTKTASMAAAVSAEFGAPFADLYWGWVRNQVFECTYDLGGGLGNPCELNTNALTGGATAVFTYTAAASQYPFTTTYVTLPPLTAAVVEIVFPHTKTGAFVQVGYAECANIADPNAEAACVLDTQKLVHARIYEQGEVNCAVDILPGMIPPFEGERFLAPGVGKRFFVVVANGDHTQAHEFNIFVE